MKRSKVRVFPFIPRFVSSNGNYPVLYSGVEGSNPSRSSNSRIAQLVEQHTDTVEVRGSSPFMTTLFL